MALLDAPEIGETTAATMRGEIRRRPSVKADARIGDGLFDSFSSSKTNSSEEGETLNNDSNENGEEQIGDGDRRKEELKGTGEKVNQGGVKDGRETSVVHYAYRSSAPAHRRIKESPLSSDAIFQQVWKRGSKISIEIIEDLDLERVKRRQSRGRIV